MTETTKRPANARVLVADDEPSSRLNIRDALRELSIDVEEAVDGAAAIAAAERTAFDAILLDIRMPGMDGLSALSQLVRTQPGTPVVIFTAFGTSERAIEAMKMGAFDYLTKPFDLEELLSTMRRAIEYRAMSKEIQQFRRRLAESTGDEYSPDAFISGSSAMQKILKMIGKVAPSDATVLIEGETGTGKELVANAVWYHSHRKERPFIKVNCAAIPDQLLESELFGHEKGAFTDAVAQRKGYFEIADGGTLFLDEVSEMSPNLQSKLLRVLEQKEFQRVGGRETVRVDVRLIAATNRDLQQEVLRGRFRQDVFFRLQVVHIRIPPLRDRLDDIGRLTDFFIGRYGKGRSLVIADDARRRLEAYAWPGNVRELENVIERAAVVAQGDLIMSDHIALSSPAQQSDSSARPQTGVDRSLRSILEEVERKTILEALHRQRWNKSKTARMLGIDRRVLFDKIKHYGLSPDIPTNDE